MMLPHRPVPDSKGKVVCMDQKLVEQFIAGDPSAVTPLRNQLRTLAARVLGAPQWSLQDSGLRAQMEREAAQNTLESGENSVQALTEEAMSQAGASGIRFLRRRDVVIGEHPDPLEMARVGLGAASAAQVARVEGHLTDCEPCRHHMEALRHALRTAATAQAAPKAPTRPLPQPAAPRPRSARRKDKPLPPKPKRSAPKSKGTQSGSLPILPFLALLAVVGAVVWKLQPSDQQRVWARAALLPDELPPAQRAPLYEGPAKRAISQLRDGHCRESATTLHLEAKGQSDPYLHWYEGTAWVCARDGDKALQAFDQVARLAESDTLPWGYDWWRAQALILEGEDEQALELLDTLAQREHGRSADARALASALRSSDL